MGRELESEYANVTLFFLSFLWAPHWPVPKRSQRARQPGEQCIRKLSRGKSRWQRVRGEPEGPWKTPSVMVKVKLNTIPWFHWEPRSHYSLYSWKVGLVLSFIRRPFNHTCCIPLGPILGSYKVQDLVRGLERKPP